MNQLVKLTLGSRLFPSLRMEDGEDHHDRDRRDGHLEGRHPARRKLESSNNHHDDNRSKTDSQSYHRKGAVMFDPIENAAQYGKLLRAVQDSALLNDRSVFEVTL